LLRRVFEVAARDERFPADVVVPRLPERALLPRDVREPVSRTRPCFDELRRERELLARVDAAREELRPAVSELRDVVLRSEDRPSLRFWLRDR
jgi:hypothetical protein